MREQIEEFLNWLMLGVGVYSVYNTPECKEWVGKAQKKLEKLDPTFKVTINARVRGFDGLERMARWEGSIKKSGADSKTFVGSVHG
jgi:hypothetical protein